MAERGWQRADESPCQLWACSMGMELRYVCSAISRCRLAGKYRKERQRPSCSSFRICARNGKLHRKPVGTMAGDLQISEPTGWIYLGLGRPRSSPERWEWKRILGLRRWLRCRRAERWQLPLQRSCQSGSWSASGNGWSEICTSECRLWGSRCRCRYIQNHQPFLFHQSEKVSDSL